MSFVYNQKTFLSFFFNVGGRNPTPNLMSVLRITSPHMLSTHRQKKKDYSLKSLLLLYAFDH